MQLSLTSWIGADENSVVWFNLGMHHMPHTGDLPNTVFSTAHSSMLIEPLNYLLGDPSQASSQRWWDANARRRLLRRCTCSGTCLDCSHVTE